MLYSDRDFIRLVEDFLFERIPTKLKKVYFEEDEDSYYACISKSLSSETIESLPKSFFFEETGEEKEIKYKKVSNSFSTL